MSVVIHVELRDEEGIFNKRQITGDQLRELLRQALKEDSGHSIEGPFRRDEAEVFLIKVSDPRDQWQFVRHADKAESGRID